MIEKLIFPDPETAARGAADLITGVYRKAVLEHSRFSFVLSGGSTPRRLYEILAELEICDDFDWQQIDFFLGR